FIVGLDEAGEPDRQRGGIHEAVVVIARVTAALPAVPAFEDLLADPVAAVDVILAGAAEKLLADPGGAVEREPAHDLWRGVVAARQAGLPDAVVRSLPAVRGGVGEILNEVPTLAGEGCAAFQEDVHEIDARRVDVELDLPGGGVGDAEGAAADITGQ